MKNYIYFSVIVAAILTMLSLFQGTAHAASDAGKTSPPPDDSLPDQKTFEAFWNFQFAPELHHFAE